MNDMLTAWLALLLAQVSANAAYLPFLFIVALMGAMIARAHLLENTTFNFYDLFTGDNGKASLDKVGKTTGYLALTWWFIDLAAQGTATAAEATVYGGLLVVAAAANKAIDMKGVQDAADSAK